MSNKLKEKKEEKLFYNQRAPDSWLKDLNKFGTGWRKPFLETAPYLIVVFKEKYEITPTIIPTDHANQEDREVIFRRSCDKGCVQAKKVDFTISGTTNSMRFSSSGTGSENNAEIKCEGLTSSRAVSNNRTRHSR